MRLYITTLLFFLLLNSYSQTVKIDSVYTFTSQDSGCNAYLVSKHRIANNCNFVDTAIEVNGNEIRARMCYSMGQITSFCYRRDTICLGSFLPGVYNVNVVIAAGNNSCESAYRFDSVYTPLVLIPTSIADVISNTFTIYPNPATSQLNCEVSSASGQYSIYSITGSQLIQPTAIPTTKFNVDVSMLPRGIYYMAIQDDKQRYVQKFVKQ